jgi:hypothetical protein
VVSRLHRRLDRIEQQVRSQAESNSNLVPVTIPWSDEDGGPIHAMVPPEFIANLMRAYGPRKGAES